MKSFVEPALEVVTHLLEDDDDDLVKQISVQSEEGYWTQIDGDFGDPWTYGGSWYNPVKAQVLHFEGIENEEDTDPDKVEIPATMLAKLPPENEDWRENHERDKIIQNYQIARAEFLDNRKKRDFYLMDVPAEVPPWLRHYEEMVRKALGEDADYDNWPVANKLVEIGRYSDFNLFSFPTRMDKLEAEKFLRTTL
jgi:hypothetical protein